MRQVWARAALFAASLVWVGSASAADDPTPPPSYSKDVRPFLNKYCMNCHNDARPRAGVSIETFGDLIKESRRPLVVPEKPDDSRIMQTLSGKAKPMPPPGAATQGRGRRQGARLDHRRRQGRHRRR